MAFQKVEFEFPEDDDDNKMAIEETSAVEIDITGKKTAEDFAADEAPADKPESKKDSDDDDLEIEVVDDTPKADRNRKPSEPPEDVTDEELEKYSDQVQKRIKHFTKGYHDERRAKEEVTPAERLGVRIQQAEFGTLLASAGVVVLFALLIWFSISGMISLSNTIVFFLGLRLQNTTFSSVSSALMRFARAKANSF